jgi:hypothetical protein
MRHSRHSDDSSRRRKQCGGFAECGSFPVCCGSIAGSDKATAKYAPAPVTPDRGAQCLVSPEAAIPVSGSRIDPAYDRSWVDFCHRFQHYARMIYPVIRAAALSIVLAYPSVSIAQAIPEPPSKAELELIVRDNWSNYAKLIRRQDGLNATPLTVRRIPEAICRHEVAGYFECVLLIEYDLRSDLIRSSLFRRTFGRDDQGRLVETIVLRH